MNENWSNIRNPWKGLEAYGINDTIYGRDEEIQTLYSRIIYNMQTVVYGKSGIGKSSIINAGIIPRALIDGFLPINIRLAHTDDPQHPTAPYVEQIKQAIAKALRVEDATTEEYGETLWELFHKHPLLTGSKDGGQPVKPILIFDQFEEIFTLERDRKRVRDFFHQLGDLINNIMPEVKEEEVGKNGGDLLSRLGVSKRPDYSNACDFHLVFTLREDYLSHLERHSAFIPAMKDNRFPILPLTAKQAYEAIVNPVPGLVSPEVAHHIIRQVVNDKDGGEDGDIIFSDVEVDAAVLSIYMHQLFELRPDRNLPISDNLVVEKGDTIIRDFYEEMVGDLPEEEIAVIEDKLLTYDDKRDNEAYDNILKDSSNMVSKKTLDTLIKRKLLRTFHHGDVKRVELMHDILCDIISKRIKEREIKKLREEEQLKRKKLLRKAILRYRLMLAAILATMGVAGYFAYKYFNKKIIADDKIVDVNFIFLPDRLLDGEPWQCDVVMGLLSDTTFHAQWVDIEDTISKRHIIGPRADTLKVKVPLSKLDREFKVIITSEADNLCKDTVCNVDFSDQLAKADINVIDYHISLTRKKFFSFEGDVKAEDGTPLSGTIIILDDKLDRTDEKGHFIIALADTNMLRNKTLIVVKSEYQNVELKEDRLEAFMNGKQTIRLALRDSNQFENEYKQMLSILENEGRYTTEDSSYMIRNFGSKQLYTPSHNVIKASDGSTIVYFYRKTSDKNVALKSEIFGFIKGKNVRLFKGLLPQKKGESKWDMDIVAYDRYYNKERIIGPIEGRKLIIENVFPTY